jgi:hypothetical protein
MSRTLVLLTTLLLTNICLGQLPIPNQPIYKHFTSENTDLPTNNIYKVIVGTDGYVWLATDRGLIKYNGKEFETINLGQQEDIVMAYKTNQNILLLLCYNGHTKGIDLTTHTIVNTDSLWGLNKLENNGRPFLMAFEEDDQIILIKKEYEDKQKHLLYNVKIKHNKATISSDISAIKKYLSRYYNNNVALNDKSVLNFCRKWIEQQLFVQCDDSIVIVDNQLHHRFNNTKSFFDGQYSLPTKTKVTSGIIVGTDLWLATLEKGLVNFKDYFIDNNSKKNFTQILPYSISSIAKDNTNGNIWVSTLNNGLFLFHGNDIGTRLYNKVSSGLISDNVGFVHSFSQGITAIGAIGSLTMIGKKGIGYRYNNIMRISDIADVGNKWYFIKSDLINEASKNSKGFPNKLYRSKFKTHNFGWKDGQHLGNNYFKISTEGIVHFSNNKIPELISLGLIKNATTFLPLADRNFIVGTTWGIYNKGRKLPWLTQVKFNKIGLFNNNLICCTNKGIYSIPIAQLENPSALHQINSRIAYDVQHDDKYFFFHTDNGILVLDKKSKNIVVNYSFLYHTLPFDIRNFFIDSQWIVVASNRGVFYFPKNEFINTKSIIPKIHILNSLNGDKASDSECSCYYDSKLVASFNIDILDYNKEPKQIMYRVLKNGSIFYDWKIIKQNNSFSLEKLEPGEYIIQYDITNNYANWHKTMLYNLTIIPQWWQLWWINAIEIIESIMFASYLIYLYISYINQKSLQKIKDKLRNKELEAQALAAQLNPHFVFNALIPFQDYTIRGDTAGALAYVNKFSKLMRGILTHSRLKTISLQNELSFITYYIEVQQYRFNNSFDWIINIDKELDITHIEIPTLLLQPLIENAIEHGVHKLNYRGKIELNIAVQQSILYIYVCDNGNGFNKASKIIDNHALKIIEERLILIKKINGVGSMTLNNNSENGGAIVLLQLPYTLMNMQNTEHKK